EVVDALVEAADLAEEVGPHEGAGAGHDEHVAHSVVLCLVELTALHERCGEAGPVERLADLEETTRIVPGDELGTDDGGVRTERLLDEHADGVGRRRYVVVAQEVERSALHDLEHLVGSGTE